MASSFLAACDYDSWAPGGEASASPPGSVAVPFIIAIVQQRRVSVHVTAVSALLWALCDILGFLFANLC
ncbi:hypothetical protein [Paratractidigestivibacter sp.]|uniref:hypothetical protein n=1 Tax=Paratractidigestivibacter sp. TaxID=2847316 RepID=UPI002ABE5279|nr:hypothetical protein [Paratractidigestivibacter sp.]